MADYTFIAQIQANLDMSDADSQLQSFIKKCESQKIKLSVDPNSFTNVDFSKIGKSIGEQIKKGINDGIGASPLNIPEPKIPNKNKPKSPTPKIYDMSELEKQGRMYFTKISDTVDKMVPTINKKFEDLGFTDINVKGIEQANGEIKSFTVTARDSTQVLKEFNFQRQQLSSGKGGTVTGFAETDNVKVKETSATVQAKQLEKQNKELEKVMRQREELVNKYNTAQSKLNDFSSTLSGSKSLYENTNQYTRAKSYMENAQSISERISSEISKGDNANFDKITTDLREMTTAANKAYSEFSRLEQPINAVMAVKASNSTLSWLENNSKAAKEYGAALEDLADKQRKATTQGELTDLNNQVNVIKGKASRKGLTGASWTDELKRATGQIAQFAGTYGAIQQFENTIVNSVGELKDINSILTEISKTSDLTTSELKDLGDASFDAASEFGRTASDYLTGVQEMSRSGFYGQQAEDLARLSILGQAAGDMSADVSNSYLLATNAAYQYEGSVEKLNAVLDGQNMITNRNSVSMDDMAQATSEAASMAAQTGTTIEELSAMIGTMEARTKSGGAEVGNAIKAILVNLSNTSSTKVVETLQAAGASMTEYVNGVEQLRNPIDILRDLAKTYNSLEDSDPLKAEILTNIGQKYHANKLAALLTGWDDYEKMLTDYSEGAGSAAVEAEKSATNWEGSLNKLSNSFTELVNNFVNSDAVIGGLNFFDGLIQGADTLVDSLGTLGTVGASLGLLQGVKNKGKIVFVNYALAM